MFSYIIYVNNKINILSETYTKIFNNCNSSDQIIIVHNGQNKLGKSFFPSIANNTIYFHNEKPINECLNFAIKFLAKNDNLIILNKSCNPSNEFFNKIKNLEIENNNIYYPSKVIISNNIEIENNDFLSCFILKRNEILEKGGIINDFEKNFNLAKFDSLINLKEKFYCKFTCNTSFEFIKHPISIISLDKNFKPNLFKNDEIFYSNGEIDNFLNIFQICKNDCIIIISDNQTSNYFNIFRNFFDKEKILINNFDTNGTYKINDFYFPLIRESLNKINNLTSICFSKNIIGKILNIEKQDRIESYLKNLIIKSKLEIYNCMISFNNTKGGASIIFSGLNPIKNKIVKKIEPINPIKIPLENINFDLNKFIWKNVDDFPKPLFKSKPNICFICDVKDWAWWIKSEYLKKYLEPYYNCEIILNYTKINLDKFDLVCTYGPEQVSLLRGIPLEKRISGSTAHRDLNWVAGCLSDCVAIHANSILLYNELKKVHPIVYYVPNGVDTNLFKHIKPVLQKERIIFGHVGKRSPFKNQQKFILPLLKKMNVEIKMHLNNHENKIQFSEMYNVYQDLDVFIVASNEDGTPNPALEAGACGRCIISNKIGNMPELIKDGYNGFLVNLLQEEYIEKINYFRENRDKVIEMGKNNRKEIEENWQWKDLYKNYLKMFDDVLGIKRDKDMYLNPSLKHLEE